MLPTQNSKVSLEFKWSREYLFAALPVTTVCRLRDGAIVAMKEVLQSGLPTAAWVRTQRYASDLLLEKVYTFHAVFPQQF